MPLKGGKYKGAHWATRTEILRMIKMRGSLASAEMAKALGISSMAVRQHLQELELAGDVFSREVSSGKGRPTKYWELTKQSDRHFPDRHRDLMLDLLEGLKGNYEMDRLLEWRGDRQVEAYGKRINEKAPVYSRARALARIRSEEGYMARAEKGENGECYLIENHCPICAAAESCSGLCATELMVFRRCLGPDVGVERTEHIMDKAKRCVYRIEPKTKASRGERHHLAPKKSDSL